MSCQIQPCCAVGAPLSRIVSCRHSGSTAACVQHLQGCICDASAIKQRPNNLAASKLPWPGCRRNTRVFGQALLQPVLAVPTVPAAHNRVLMEHCWSADPAARPSTKALQECIGLMIADRQHSLGRPVSSVDAGESPQVVRHTPQAPTYGCGHNLSVQLAAQPHLQQQEQQRQPTPLRLPSHSQPQRMPRPFTLPVQLPQAQHHDQQQGADPHQHLRDACSQLPTSSHSLRSVSYDSSGHALTTSSSLGTSGSSRFAQEPCAAGKRMSAATVAALAPAGAPAAAGSAAEQDRARHADRSAPPSQGFVRDL